MAPRTTFDVDRVAVEAGKPLRVPLLQATTGEIELVLRCHHDLSPGATQLAFELPRAVADAIAPADVSVTPSADISLAVREGDLEGLTRVRGEGPPTTDSERVPLAFRGQAGKLRFAADLQVESRSVVADIRSRLSIDDKAANVEETIDYTIHNEPLGELLFDVPGWLATADRIEWELDGQPVVPNRDDREASVERAVRFRLLLPEKRQGDCRLVIRYPLRVEPFVAGQELPIDVPLVMPAVTELTANELSVIAPRTCGSSSAKMRGTWNPRHQRAEANGLAADQSAAEYRSKSCGESGRRPRRGPPDRKSRLDSNAPGRRRALGPRRVSARRRRQSGDATAACGCHRLRGSIDRRWQRDPAASRHARFFDGRPGHGGPRSRARRQLSICFAFWGTRPVPAPSARPGGRPLGARRATGNWSCRATST